MSIFENIKAGRVTNGHGEVNFFRIEDGSVDLGAFEDFAPGPSGYVVGHSENGHHHVLEREGVVTMRRYQDSKGMAVLYAIVEKPVALRQDANAPHAEQIVEPGEYLITNNVDYDPFLQQARRVAD